MRIPLWITVALFSAEAVICSGTEWPFKESEKVEELLTRRFPPCKDSSGGNSGREMMLNTHIFSWDRSSYIKTGKGEMEFFIKTFEDLGYEVVVQGKGEGGATDSIQARKLKFKLESDNEEIALFIISQHTVSKIDGAGVVSIYWCCNVESKK